MKAFVVGGDNNYAGWLTDDITLNMEEADLVIFTGGDDVDPNLYGETPNKRTKYNTNRDIEELLYFDKAIKLKKPVLGVCRGSQFICIANNGSLIQHVSDHALYDLHDIKDVDSEEIVKITSTHHQMVFPFKLPKTHYKIIAIAEPRRSECYIRDKNNIEYTDEEVVVEPEIIYYPKTQCLGIQGHPENMNDDSAAVIYCKKLINQYLLPKDKQINTKVDIKDKKASTKTRTNFYNALDILYAPTLSFDNMFDFMRNDRPLNVDFDIEPDQVIELKKEEL